MVDMPPGLPPLEGSEQSLCYMVTTPTPPAGGVRVSGPILGGVRVSKSGILSDFEPFNWKISKTGEEGGGGNRVWKSNIDPVSVVSTTIPHTKRKVPGQVTVFLTAVLLFKPLF